MFASMTRSAQPDYVQAMRRGVASVVVRLRVSAPATRAVRRPRQRPPAYGSPDTVLGITPGPRLRSGVVPSPPSLPLFGVSVLSPSYPCLQATSTSPRVSLPCGDIGWASVVSTRPLRVVPLLSSRTPAGPATVLTTIRRCSILAEIYGGQLLQAGSTALVPTVVGHG